MSGPSQLSQASFPCKHCQQSIFIPAELPPTTAPCPHCGKEVTSPDQGIQPVPITNKGDSNKGVKNTVAAPSPVAPVTETIRLDAPEKPTQSASVNEDLGMPTLGDANQRRGKGNKAAVVAAVVILLGAGAVTFWLANSWGKNQQGDVSQTGKAELIPTMSDEAWLKTGWKKDVTEILNAFMTAKSPEERLQYAIPNEGVLEQLKIFYPDSVEDTEAPKEAFGHIMGGDIDHKRGIFLMQYRQPAQVDIRDYFAPIGSLEVVMRQRESSLMEMAYRIDEHNLSEPIGINAFFKKTDEGLKLDTSVFIQGRFRTFRAFVDYPRPGKTQIFRVVVSETISHALRDDKRYRTYRLEDFAYPKDFVNVPVLVDSAAGKILSAINWRGMDRERVPRTATIELGWNNEAPSKIGIVKVVCWEFLGVGGKIGNTTSAESGGQ